MVIEIKLTKDGISTAVTIDLEKKCCYGEVKGGSDSAKLDAELGQALQEAILGLLIG